MVGSEFSGQSVKILLANKYFYIKGGAENSFFVTANLLKRHGHEINFFSVADPRNIPSEDARCFISGVEYDHPNIFQAAKSAGRLLYSWEARRNLDCLIQDRKPDLAHLNNIYHQISPSILHSLKQKRIPTVMSLRDYKVVCASYSMIASGKICEACKNGRHYQCFLKKCVKNSRIKSLLNVIEMYLHHSILHLYDLVDVYISPSRFLKTKVEEMGFKGKVVYIPNFVEPSDFKPAYAWKEKSICFIGRLSKEKGVATLIEAVKGLDVTLKVIGEGPLRKELEEGARRMEQGTRSGEQLQAKRSPNSDLPTNIRFLGYLSGDALKEEIRNSMFTVIPSEWYENNPRSVIESFALGKPVIGARIGGIPELVQDGQTGWTYEPFNVSDLRDQIIKLVNDPVAIGQMGKHARQFVESELNPEVHYQKLMKVYEYAKTHDAALLEGFS